MIKKEALNLALRDKLSAEALETIDFSVPRQEDPFEIDLSCLPLVPKTDSRESLVSFAHQIAEDSQGPKLEKVPESNSAEQESSAILAGASSIHESRESRSFRTDSRTVSHCGEEDAKLPLPVRKASSAKPTHHSSGKPDSEVKKKDRTFSGPRSHYRQRRFRTSQGAMGSCRSKSPKAYRSSSRSRSPSSRRHSRLDSP